MTKLALATPQDSSLTIRDEQLSLLKDTIAKGASDGELSLFVATCNRLRLDPFARQIFLVKRYDSQVQREVATSQVSIDGLRLVADGRASIAGRQRPNGAAWMACGVTSGSTISPLLLRVVACTARALMSRLCAWRERVGQIVGL